MQERHPRGDAGRHDSTRGPVGAFYPRSTGLALGPSLQAPAAPLAGGMGLPAGGEPSAPLLTLDGEALIHGAPRDAIAWESSGDDQDRGRKVPPPRPCPQSEGRGGDRTVRWAGARLPRP